MIAKAFGKESDKKDKLEVRANISEVDALRLCKVQIEMLQSTQLSTYPFPSF